jgi:uncharacterized protein (TIGR00251 family)
MPPLSREQAAALDVRSGEGHSLLRVKATPKASRNEILGAAEGALRLKVQAPPSDGAANAAIREFLADALHVSRSAITLLKGQTSREKTFRIEGLDASEVRARLITSK